MSLTMLNPNCALTVRDPNGAFVANAISLTPLQWSANARRYSKKGHE